MKAKFMFLHCRFQMLLFSKTGTFIAVVFFFNTTFTFAQVTLNANGPGNTYELISSVFGSGNGTAAVEAPDQTPNGSHQAFGRHIAEVWDADLNKYVFEFYSHFALDNDVSTTYTDRQRVEIKTYASSPANLKGTLGETVTYKWQFKIPIGFQPSSKFTHIHQVKAVDGDDSDPIFTLTPRKGSPNILQLIYVKDINSGTDIKAFVNLSQFEGIWVEATETIKVGTGTSGTYSIIINRVSDAAVVLSYSSPSIQTIRTAATDPGSPQVANSFIRPKWGIYRSILDPTSLRDDSIRFSDFSITEGTLSAKDFLLGKQESVLITNPVLDNLEFSETILNYYDHIKIFNANGQLNLSAVMPSKQIDISNLKSGLYIVIFLKDNKETKGFKFIKK